jgi:hypothetical protein
MADLVVEGVTGYSFKSENSVDLVSKFKLLISKEITQSMGLKAKENIIKWSFVNVALAIESLINN